MKETNLLKLIQIQLSKSNCRLFRNNSGKGWQGARKNVKDSKAIFIENARIVHFGLCPGSSDLIGWTSVEVTPEMIGKKVAIFTAIEGKVKTKASLEQLNFIKAVKDSGGYAGIATTPEAALNIISILPGFN